MQRWAFDLFCISQDKHYTRWEPRCGCKASPRSPYLHPALRVIHYTPASLWKRSRVGGPGGVFISPWPFICRPRFSKRTYILPPRNYAYTIAAPPAYSSHRLSMLAASSFHSSLMAFITYLSRRVGLSSKAHFNCLTVYRANDSHCG